MPDELGEPKPFYIISLSGLPCTVTNGMRKLKMQTSFGVSHEEMLVMAARQLKATQGKTTFDFTCEMKRLTVEALSQKIAQDMAKRGEIAKKAEKKDDDNESDDEEVSGDEVKTKKVQQSGFTRLANAQMQPAKRAKSTKGPARRTSKKTKPDEDLLEDEVALSSGTLPQELQLVSDELNTTPKCFYNLDVARIFLGKSSRGQWMLCRAW